MDTEWFITNPWPCSVIYYILSTISHNYHTNNELSIFHALSHTQTDKKKERLAEANVRLYAAIASQALPTRSATSAGAVDAIVDPSAASADG